MSDQSLHLAKWMSAVEQVTVMHLVKNQQSAVIFWSVWEITYLRLYKRNILMLGQVLTRTAIGSMPILTGKLQNTLEFRFYCIYWSQFATSTY